jgi:hypothetical protein
MALRIARAHAISAREDTACLSRPSARCACADATNDAHSEDRPCDARKVFDEPVGRIRRTAPSVWGSSQGTMSVPAQ